MAPMALVLILVPRPSLSLHPSQGVSLGDTVTLRCHLPQSAAWVRLYKDGCLSSEKDIDKVQDTAEFFLVGIKQEDAVKYSCQYQILEPLWTSNMSDPVELMVTDPRFPPPGISMSPDECVKVGMNVTMQCRNNNYGGIIFLHKDGHSAPIQHQEPNGGGMANFTLVGVTPADTGTYRCSYRVGSSYLLFSPLGDNVTLKVTPATAHPGAERMSRGNLVVAVVRGCAAALVFGLGLYFILDARSFWIRRDESPAGEGA
ncbi:platelet glycoprotein VI-like [Numida meleagris]|uniref:platelet glycoprotein VI-like n=1 Tax=Numida meleagris TaxID=8996 RepID=UPI000B3DBEDF|nr:platelet glycoprotein VI-like [Numida meleagris]